MDQQTVRPAPPGVLTVGDGTAVWAWAAVRIEAAADLTETREYADLPEDERRIKAVAAETAWLAGQWDTGHDARIELRYLTDPAERRISCALLARVRAGSQDSAVTAALALRDRLGQLPHHVHSAPVEDSAEVARWLTPFTPDPAGLAEIRKRYRTGLPNRPDAGVHYYLAPQPFTAAAPPWDALWQAFTTHPHPLMLTVGLEPYRLPDDLGPLLHRIATHYGRLAAPGQMPEGLWSPPAPNSPRMPSPSTPPRCTRTPPAATPTAPSAYGSRSLPPARSPKPLPSWSAPRSPPGAGRPGDRVDRDIHRPRLRHRTTGATGAGRGVDGNHDAGACALGRRPALAAARTPVPAAAAAVRTGRRP
ncbi:hypothetical protein GCM10020000_41980 [Streptomyces olivoverticillatus]